MTTKIKIGGAAVLLLLTIITITAYHRTPSSHEKMLGLLKNIRDKNYVITNPFNPEVKMAHLDSLLRIPGNLYNPRLLTSAASLSLKVGKEDQAVKLYEQLVNKIDFMSMDAMMPNIGIAYMRLGERSNCMLNHNGASCIFPIKDGGIHSIKTGSTKAILRYAEASSTWRSVQTRLTCS